MVPCLDLIPHYDTEAEAEEILEEVYEAIVEAELDSWHRATGAWPVARTYPVVRPWFEVRFYPLSQDQVGEELTATEVAGEFIGELRTALEGVEDGQAFAYRKGLGQCDSREHLDAEFRATLPWDFRRNRSARRSASLTDLNPVGQTYRCGEFGSFARTQELLRQGHTNLDGNGEGEACKSLR